MVRSVAPLGLAASLAASLAATLAATLAACSGGGDTGNYMQAGQQALSMMPAQPGGGGYGAPAYAAPQASYAPQGSYAPQASYAPPGYSQPGYGRQALGQTGYGQPGYWQYGAAGIDPRYPNARVAPLPDYQPDNATLSATNGYPSGSAPVGTGLGSPLAAGAGPGVGPGMGSNSGSGVGGLLGGLFGGGAGAAAGQPPRPVERTFELSLSATPNINPDPTGRPSPVKVTVYQLATEQQFVTADFFKLSDDDLAALRPSLLAKEDVVLSPGQRDVLLRRVEPNARFVGVIGAFRDLDGANWRGIAPIAPGAPSTQLNALVEDRQLTVRQGQP